MTMNISAGSPRWWVPGDWNGFFGLFTNVVLNVIVLTGLCLHIVNLPPDIVYGRILPALGIALPLGNLYYAYLVITACAKFCLPMVLAPSLALSSAARSRLPSISAIRDGRRSAVGSAIPWQPVWSSASYAFSA
jgi:hypothetical protein